MLPVFGAMSPVVLHGIGLSQKLPPLSAPFGQQPSSAMEFPLLSMPSPHVSGTANERVVASASVRMMIAIELSVLMLALLRDRGDDVVERAVVDGVAIERRRDHVKNVR